MAATILSSFAAVALIGALFVPISLYFGWAASVLWGWFLVPLGLPAVSVMHAWGITLALSMLRPRINADKSENKDWASGLVGLLIAPPLSVAFGYAIKNWWM